MYGMVKTTVYLPDELKARLAHVAAREGRSEAEVIRASIESYTAERPRPRPRVLVDSLGERGLSERVDEALADGFGRD
jgi:hypothetical protein